jgi:hypothetical protein
MIAEERLALVQVKIERANKHIRDLDSEIKAFFNSKPYGVVSNKDAQTGKVRHYLTRMDPIPIAVVTITGDALQNLRTALEYLIQHLWMVGTSSSTTRADLQFPVGSDPANFKSRFGGKIQSLRQDAKDALLACEVYPTGKGDQLWRLCTLNNFDKHRLLLTVISATGGLTVSTQGIMEDLHKSLGLPTENIVYSTATFVPAVPTILKVGDEVFKNIIGFGSNFDPEKDGEFPFYISFNEPQVLQGGPLLETLKHFSNVVSSTVTSFKPCLA